MLLPNDIGEYKVLNKQSYLPFKDKLFDLFNSFSQTNDKLKDNYTIDNLQFNESKEIEWKNPAFGIISKLIHDHQISYCKSINKDYVFVSQETKLLYLKKWITQANQYSPGWVLCEEKKRVTNGTSKSAIQHVIYKKISNTNESFFL